MGNGKKPTNAQPEAAPTKPQDFVVVLAYTSDDGELPDEFLGLIEDMKALYTFKPNMRAYALIEDAATNVLALVEESKGGSGE